MFFLVFPRFRIPKGSSAALAAITNLDFVDNTVEGYEDYEPSDYSKDCIATIRSFVNSVNDPN